MATQAQLDASFRASRERWSRLEATTVRRVRSSYRRATRALEQQIARTPGTVTRTHLERLHDDLTAMEVTLNVDTLAALQRGITTTVSQASMDAWSTQLGLGQLTGGSARLRGVLQGTAEAETVAWLSRVGPDGLQLSDRVWAAGQTWRTSIERVMEAAITSGQSMRETARLLDDLVVPGRASAHRLETARALGVPRDTSYRATRLARTEINAAGREATVMTNRTNPFYRGVYWRRSNVPYPCEVCDELEQGGPRGDGFYPEGQEPTSAASHPNCRCVILPDYDDPDEVARRLEDWLNDPTAEPDLDQAFGTAQAGGRPGLEVPVGSRGTAPAPTPTPPPAAPTPPPVPAPPSGPPPFRRATTVADANAYAGELGIRARWGRNDLELANLVNRDLATMAEQGYDLPDELTVENRPRSARVASYASPVNRGQADELIVNRGNDFWKDPVASARAEGDGGFWTSGEPSHVVRHELGHKAHYDTDPVQYQGRLRRGWGAVTSDVRDLQERLTREVSRYAARNPHEFVAEVFAGAFGGKTYPDEIVRLYESVGGPRLPTPP
jgi:hypothetical protein